MSVVIESRGWLRVVTVDNPGKRNALDPALCAELVAAFGDLGAVRAIVLTGAGDKAFCAGFDLDALADAEAAFPALIAALAACPVPIVCALNGAAFGGGAELAACCDLRVAHAGVRMALPPARLGIVYPLAGLARFTALVGEARARQLFLTARVVDAETAERWGLVDHLVPAAEVLPRALALAEEIAALAPLAVQGMRASFEALIAARTRLDPELAAHLDGLRRAAWTSDDVREARQALAERRPAVFSGR